MKRLGDHHCIGLGDRPFLGLAGVLVVVAGVLLSATPVHPAGLAETVAAPVHLAALPDGSLGVALGGGLYRFDPADGRFHRLADLAGEVRALAVLGDRLVVALHAAGSRLELFDLQGQSRGSWGPLPVDPVAGLAGHGERIYVTGVTGFQVHRLEARAEGNSVVARIYGARSVGALARSPRGVFYVADPSQGVVLAVTEGAATSEPLAEDAGTPVALAVDAGRDRLLILDALNGRIWTTPLDPARQSTVTRRELKGVSYRTVDRARPFSVLSHWQAPVALAVAADGTVWWADAGTAELVRLSPDGEETGRHPLPGARPAASRR